MDRYQKALDAIRDLEAQVQQRAEEAATLREQLHRQAVDLAIHGHESVASGDSHSAEITSYQIENKRLVELVQRVADSRTKFAKEAKALLGQT